MCCALGACAARTGHSLREPSMRCAYRNPLRFWYGLPALPVTLSSTAKKE